MKAKRTESQLMALLAERYPANAYALMAQVGNATGGRQQRWADALVMSLWPSRGLDLMGFEIKSARHDWFREMNSPEKAEPVASYCDRWWIVASDETVVNLSELPGPWGLLVAQEVKGKVQLVAVKDAERLASAKPCDRSFLAAMLRRAVGSSVPVATVETLAEEKAAARVQAAIDNAPGDSKRVRAELDKLREAVQEFEQASGISIDGGGRTWSAHAWGYAKPAEIGAMLKMLLGADAGMRLERDLSSLRFVASTVKATIEAIEEARRGLLAPVVAP